MWSVAAILVGALVPVIVLLCLRVRRRLARSGRLPPGSMGWPFVGETLQLYSQHPNKFFASREKRYGEIVKTHILGCSAVMMASAEAAKLVLVSHANTFKPSYPPSKEMLIGRHAVFFQHGERHQRLRRLLQLPFTPEGIRRSVSRIQGLALDVLNSIEGRDISAFAEMKKFTFDVGFILACGSYEGINKEDLKSTYQTLESGYNALPINFPGTGFNKSMKLSTRSFHLHGNNLDAAGFGMLARKQLNAMVAKLIADRRANCVSSEFEDILGVLIKQNLPVDQIADNVIGVIFAAQDTTASVLTWMIKYLSMNTSLLADVRAEQEVVRSTICSDLGELAWADTKKMPITSRVLQETLRLASVLSFTFRESTEDVEYNGFLIPKGWKVMPLFRNIHHNPEYYPEPYKFDPSRFEKPMKSNTFIPFGNGVHSCLGSELARLEILTFVHHLVTKFRWELLEPKCGVEYRPFPVPKEGMPMHIMRI